MTVLKQRQSVQLQMQWLNSGRLLRLNKRSINAYTDRKMLRGHYAVNLGALDSVTIMNRCIGRCGCACRCIGRCRCACRCHCACCCIGRCRCACRSGILLKPSVGLLRLLHRGLGALTLLPQVYLVALPSASRSAPIRLPSHPSQSQALSNNKLSRSYKRMDCCWYCMSMDCWCCMHDGYIMHRRGSRVSQLPSQSVSQSTIQPPIQLVNQSVSTSASCV